MNMVHTSLGVDSGLEHTDFVFGDDAEVIRVRFRLAGNLHLAESIAQQNLDFIRKLYFEQSSPGEYFEQIHLATEIDAQPECATKAEPDFDTLIETESAIKSVVLRDATDLLFEYLLQWINVDSIPLKLLCHDDIAVAAKKRELSLHKPPTEFYIYDKKNIGNALALWSFAFTDRSQPVNPSESKGETVDYERLSENFIDQYLPGYKTQLVEKVRDLTFPNPDIEGERRILLNLANDVDSTKFELLNYQERIKRMLEKHMLCVATTSENPQGKQLKNTFYDLPGSTADVGLFDLEAIDNAERIRTEINQTIERHRKLETSATTEPSPVTTTTHESSEADDDTPPMFELEEKILPTSFEPPRLRKSRNYSQDNYRGSAAASLSTNAPATSTGTEQIAVALPVNEINPKPNEFFSSPAFELQKNRSAKKTEEPVKFLPEPKKPGRNETWYFPLLAIAAVVGIYYLIR